MAPKSKLNAPLASDTISSDEEKQMNDMRATDSQQESEQERAPKTEEIQPGREEANSRTEQQEKPKTVPHEALEAERQRRKAVEKEREDLKIQNAKADERLKIINEWMEGQKKPTQQVEIPDPDKDALGNLKYTNDEIRVLKEYVSRQESQKQQDAQASNLMSRAASSEREFIAQNPDYTEASNFLANSRYNELTALGLGPDQARNQINMETMQLANQGLSTGKNPAEIVYAIAKLRGYQKPETAQQTQQSPAEKLTAISEGQRANQSLSDVSGNSASSGKPMNAKDLANMSDQQFAKMYAGMKGDDAQLHAIFGN